MNLRGPLRTSKRQEHPQVHRVLPQQCHPPRGCSCSSAGLSPPSWMFGSCQRSPRGSGLEVPHVHPMLRWEQIDCSFWFIPLRHLHHRPRDTLFQKKHIKCRGRSPISRGRSHFQIVTVFHSNTSVSRQQMHRYF